MIGRRLSHFEILAPIGAGGMGVVYKAMDQRLQRPVALKVLPPHLLSDAVSRERFLREARAASALNHPHIVTIHEVDSAEGVDFIAMEYLEGNALDRLVPARGLELERALGYGVQIAEGLAAAHAHGIVHRDLKPRNIFVSRGEVVKILDFGLAKPAHDPAVSETSTETQLTGAGRVVGTAAYMSPEQAEGKKLDARSDVFSFGIVLYELLAGRNPFRGESVAQLLSSILRDAPPALRTIRADVPEELARVVHKALEKDREHRYQHVDEMLADLRRLQRDVSSAASPHAGPGGAWPALGAAGLATLGLAAWLLSGRERPAPHPRRFQLLSAFPGSHRAPSLSPDGTMLAFLEVARGVPQVWVKPLGEGEPLQVTSGDVAAGRPRWSPRGDQIVFERRGQGLWSVPPLGGQPRRIAERGSCPGFFPDGERLVFDRGAELWTARLDGSEAGRLEGVPTNYFSFYISRCASVSPDGRRIAFYQPARGPCGDYWVIDAAGGEPRQLTFDSAEGGSLVWTPDGRSIVFSSARRGSRTLWRVDAEGGEPEPVTTGAGEDADPEFSRDGTKLVYGNARPSFAIMLLDTATGRQREVLERRRHLNGVSFSPRGDRIAFFSMTDQLERIFTVQPDGAALRQITAGADTADIMPRWSRDGSSLYFYRQLPAPSFRRVAAAGGLDASLVDGWRWEVEGAAAVDPAERMAAYSRWEGGQVRATRLRELRTGQERSLPVPLDDVRWSRDGSSLAGADSEGNVVVCPASGSVCQTLEKGANPVWSADGSRVYFSRRGKPLDDPNLRSVEAWVMARDGRNARRIAVLEPQLAIAVPFDVSPSDQIAWVQFRRGKEELWLAQLPERSY
jgi:Tol biopolymer transport system component